MTSPALASTRRFSPSTLPWLVAAVAVVVYAFTLNPWISFGSVSQVARLSGWLWEPDLSNPLYFLITSPLRMLPEAWIPAALNVFNALCAAATLGLLARTVAILPHDRTHEQRVRAGVEGKPLSFGSAWLPPTLAAVVCGLQLTFWENATSGTTEMINLLLFAYVIRCLLEFRLDGRHVWLWQTAFLTGVGMANNHAIVGFLPVYLATLIALKRLKFFNGRFLMRMALWGLLGASLYFLMPLLQSQNAEVPIGFWQSLKHTLVSQKNLLFGFPKKTLLLISLYSLLPILLISIRWSQSFGDVSPQGAKFATFMFNLVHGAFLVVCIWIMFDPPISPRNAGLGFPFLTFYYLTAIAIGYFIGYFLLLFGHQSETPAYTYGRNQQRSPRRSAIVWVVWALSAVTAVGLVFRNLPDVRLTNSSALRDYASLIADRIPEGNTVVLCDDAAREFVLRSALSQNNQRPDAILLSTRSLVWPQYHQMMAEKHPDRWPVNPPTNTQGQVTDRSLMSLMLLFSKSNQVCYAHPSFGYYFESFSVKPAGILNILTPYQQGEILPEPLTEQAAEFNEQFWDGPAARLLKTVEDGLTPEKALGTAQKRNPLFEKLHLADEKNATMEILGRWLSRSLNSYGVDLQRSGFLEEAGRRFQQAADFNPENVAAAVNVKFNTDLQADQPSSVRITKTIEDEFAQYGGWEHVLNANGLFDEPRFTMAVAEVFLKGQLFRQALREFDRVRDLLPYAVAPQVRYARLVSLMGDPDQALRVVQEVRDQADQFALTSTNQLELVFVEAAAYLTKKEPDNAVQVVENALSSNPKNTNLVASALQLYMRAKLFTNALDLIDRELVRRPEDVDLLINKGFVLLRITNQVPAVEVLTRALELQSNSAPARLNRAIANLQLENLEAAQADYEMLLLQFPNAHPIYFGLAEIAFRRKDTNQAIYNYQLYLTNAPPNTAEAQRVRRRLESLHGTTP